MRKYGIIPIPQAKYSFIEIWQNAYVTIANSTAANVAGERINRRHHYESNYEYISFHHRFI